MPRRTPAPEGTNPRPDRGGACPRMGKVVAGEAQVLTSASASPTGFPFKIALVPGTMSDRGLCDARPRFCDLGFLRSPFKREDGSLGYRCPAEPLGDYVKKGGKEARGAGRRVSGRPGRIRGRPGIRPLPAKLSLPGAGAVPLERCARRRHQRGPGAAKRPGGERGEPVMVVEQLGHMLAQAADHIGGILPTQHENAHHRPPVLAWPDHSAPIL